MGLALLVTGCGGSDDRVDAEQIDKASFIRQANRICEQVSGKFAAEVRSISRREEAKPNFDFLKTQLIIVKGSLIPGLEEELQQIRALGLPEEAMKDAKAFLNAYPKAIERTKAKPNAVLEEETIAPHEAITLAATKLGVTECPVTSVGGN